MGLLRFLLLVGLIWFALRLLLRALARPEPRRDAPRDRDDYRRLVPCQRCGAHIPEPADGSPAICERCRRA